jgi:hypothetical protein
MFAPRRRGPRQSTRSTCRRKWRGIIAEILGERGRRCEDPARKHPDRTTRLFGDHIVELKDGGAPLDKDNVLLRCGSCHSRKRQPPGWKGWWSQFLWQVHPRLSVSHRRDEILARGAPRCLQMAQPRHDAVSELSPKCAA